MSQQPTLRPVLGPLALTTLGIGSVIGTGIFVLTGTAASLHTGPALVLSMVVAAVACALAGLCYAELAAMIPIAGSAYTYAHASFGQFVAWIIGWDLVLEYALSASTVAVGWSGYFASFLRDIGLSLPAELTAARGSAAVGPAGEMVPGVFNLPATVVVLLVVGLLVVGISESARANTVMVIIKVAVLLLFIGLGASYVQRDNLDPFLPPNTGTFGEFGWSGVMRGAAIMFFAYIGFDAVSTAAQEARNPQRDMPVGILASLAICTVIYIAVAVVLLGIVPHRELNVADPLAVGIDATGLTWFSPVVKISALFGLFSTMLVQLLGQSRIFYSMSRDGLLPELFGKVHPRFRTPHLSTLITGLVVAVTAGFIPLRTLSELVSIGSLLAFTLVCFGVIVLRRTRPDLPRPFRVPGVPWVPVLGALVCLAQMAALPWATWERLLVWLGVGLAIYYWYGRTAGRRGSGAGVPEASYFR
jgi:APA family basic amino acid/polyamine antiporter